jgi:hypothetical protein
MRTTGSTWSAVPVDLSGVVDEGAVDRRASPVGSDILVAQEFALCGVVAFIGESQVVLVLPD